jgi:quercetin dioxygenase-like cupin family protein
MPLIGDAEKPGPYVYRFKASAGLHIPPHWHTTTRHSTVLRGTVIRAVGPPFLKSRAKHFVAGSFDVIPANQPHEEWFDEETIVHIETEGPMKTVFVNPTDDPRRRP